VHPSFSPDGTRIVYSSLGGKSGQWEIWVSDLSTGEKRMIGFGLFPTWSPDKSVDRIAFQRARQRGSRWFSLWTLDLIDGEACRVTEVAVSANAAIVCPTWSPDGHQLAFATIVSPADADGNKPMGQQDIWTVNCDGTRRRRLTDGVGMNLSPSWGSDNRIYFISDRTGSECVWSASADSAAAPTRVASKPHSADMVGSAN
jgi:Tol biopolymer transport system component